MVVLVILIGLILAAPYALQLFRKDSTINTKDLNSAIATLDKAKKSQAGDRTDNNANYYKKAAAGVVIELNTADTAHLTTLPGIGASFARRIVNYRNRLGGFFNKEQLMEVYGLDAEKYASLQAQVKVDASRVKKIPINKVSFDDLKYFPYLSFKQMNVIIQFREQHGEYASLDDMKNIAILNDEILRKIGPYLVFK
jgi:DNA uptake protein ComE-like DNA-binding protein